MAGCVYLYRNCNIRSLGAEVSWGVEGVPGGGSKFYFCEIRADPVSDFMLNFSSLRPPQNDLLNQFSLGLVVLHESMLYFYIHFNVCDQHHLISRLHVL